MIWSGIVDGIQSAAVHRSSTLITELIIAALQHDTTETVVQRQLQEGIAQLPDDVWEVSNLEAPDKRTRDAAKLETEEPAPQRRRQIDPIKELRPSKRVIRRKATQRKKKMRQVILDSIFTAAQGPAGLAVMPLDLHLVNVGWIPTGPTHGEECKSRFKPDLEPFQKKRLLQSSH